MLPIYLGTTGDVQTRKHLVISRKVLKVLEEIHQASKVNIYVDVLTI